MGIFSDIQALKAMEVLRTGGRANLSIAQITNLIINLPDAQKNLSSQAFNAVYSLYKELRKCRTKHNVDIDEYCQLAIDIIRRFDRFAPYEKYSGGNELEFSFLMNELRGSSAVTSPACDTPMPSEDFSVSFGQLGLDIQVVFLSDPIERKDLADKMATLLSNKYSITAKVRECGPNTPGYCIWLYRVPLDLVDGNYDSETNRYIFKLSELEDSTPAVDMDELLENAEIGDLIPIAFHVEYARDPQRYTLLFEDAYYQYYKYYSGRLLRIDKASNSTVFLGAYVSVDFCVSLRGKLFFNESRGITGDCEVYVCNLDGTNAIALHCLSNEKVFIAGHLQSMDKVIGITVDGDYVIVEVCRRDCTGTYNYKLFITYLDGKIVIGKRD